MQELNSKELLQIDGGIDGWDLFTGVVKVGVGVVGVVVPEPGTTTAGAFSIASGVADIVDAFDNE